MKRIQESQYVNYPTVEPIRNYRRKDELCFRRCFVELENVAQYKQMVSVEHDVQDFRKYTEETWKELWRHALCKAKCVVNDTYIILGRQIFWDTLGQICWI